MVSDSRLQNSKGIIHDTVIKQSNRPCENCGSWYIKDGSCSGCGTPVDVPDSFYEGKKKAFKHKRKVSRGTLWNKKQHKSQWR